MTPINKSNLLTLAVVFGNKERREKTKDIKTLTNLFIQNEKTNFNRIGNGMFHCVVCAKTIF